MGIEMHRLTVDRHHDLWPCPLIHLFEFFFPWVTRNMNQRIVGGDYTDTHVSQTVHRVDDGLLVSRDGSRGVDHRIPRGQMHTGMFVTRKLRQRRTAFALAAGQDDDQLPAINALKFVLLDEFCNSLEITQPFRNVGHAADRLAHQQDLPACLLCRKRHRTDTPDI